MPLGSFTHGALADLAVEDLDRMLELDETLFVEHKTDIGRDSAHGLISSVAAFANTVGGWLLVGVTNGRPNGKAERWAGESIPTLVDAVRDRLRGEIDPLPAFEARVLPHPDGSVGVIRVYESSDTPHVAIESGAVFVRDVAGKTDASDPKRPGGGARGERAYEAARIRSRAQLLELAARGREAAARVDWLFDPLRRLPLVEGGLGLRFEVVDLEVVQPRLPDRGCVVVRLAPYTLPPRFTGWSTTEAAATAIRATTKELSGLSSIYPGWTHPDPAGVSILVGPMPDERREHVDDLQTQLEVVVRAVVDAAGLVGVAHEFGPPKDVKLRWLTLEDVAREYIRPVIKGAADVLVTGEFLGRARCQVDLVALGSAVLIEKQEHRSARAWVPTMADLSLPPESSDLDAVAQRAAYAFGRSMDLPAYDPPIGP